MQVSDDVWWGVMTLVSCDDADDATRRTGGCLQVGDDVRVR